MHSKSWSIALVALLALLGCAPSNPGIQVEGILFGSDTCTYMAQANATFLLLPTLDTTVATLDPGPPALELDDFRPVGIRYVAVLQVVNRFLNRGNYVYPLMADTNSFNVQEAEIELRAIDGTPLDVGGLPSRFRVPASGFVPSATDATTPGRGIVTVEIIPAVYGDALANTEVTIVAAIRLIGRTGGDSEQTTGEFEQPIQLCNEFCRFSCNVEEDGTPVAAPVLSCFPGQDRQSLIPGTLSACRPAP